MNKSWYERKIPAFFIFACCTLLCAFVVKDIRFGESRNNKHVVYSIRFEYFGMDAVEIERLITIPLEESLAALSLLYEIRSVSEYGKSVTTVYFEQSVDTKNTYLAVRAAVDTLYETLPSAVQKPRIYSSESEQSAVLSIAVTGNHDLKVLRKYIESNLKKEFESIDGVSEVIVAGGSINEIKVEFDSDRIVAGGINPEAFGSLIQDANVVSPGSSFKGAVFDKQIVFDTKIKTLDEIRNLPVKVGEELTSISHLASIDWIARQQDEIIRVNGRECIAIVIKSAFDGNPIAISEQCKTLLTDSELDTSAYRILYDNGTVLSGLLKSVLFAVVQSFIIIILIVPLFFQSVRVTVLLILLLPVTTLWSVAQLQLLGYSLDQNILSGISIALGLVVDAALVISGIAEKKVSFAVFTRSVHKIRGAVFSSCLTTVLVLVPLYFLNYLVPGIRDISVTIALMLCNSALISCLFFPCFVFSVTESRPILNRNLFLKLERWYIRFTYRIVIFCRKYAAVCRGVFIISLCIPFVLFFSFGKNISLTDEEFVLHAIVEYEPEISAKSIDNAVTTLLPFFEREKGVTFVRSEVRTGSADIEIGFDHAKTSKLELAKSIQAYDRFFSDGFLYVPGSGGIKEKNTYEIEIAVTGDETSVCREYARKAVDAALKSGLISQGVLNFKNPERVLVITPDRSVLIKSGLSVEKVAMILRWLLFGPVVDKWIQNGEETDIRVSGKKSAAFTLEDLENMFIPAAGIGVRLDSLGRIEVVQGTGKIYRQDNRRSAYCTVQLNSSSTEAAVDTVRSVLSAIPLQKGYAFQFSKEIELLHEQYGILLCAFIACIIGILLLLIGLTENLKKAVLITAVIPSSIALPMIIKFLCRMPLETGDIVGMVVVSGLAVNNAIYIAESTRSCILYKVREKARSIFVTSLTTIAGSVPLLVTGNGGFTEELAFFMMFGTAGSVVSSMCLYPVLMKKEKKIGNKE